MRRGPHPAVALAFIADILGVRLWHKQVDIVRAVFGSARTTVVRSCTGAGKTAVAAAIALAWLLTGPDRTVITTAPTGRQVRELLWKEIRVAHARAAQRGYKLGGILPPKAPELRIKPGWLALGFSSGDPVNFQGWHSRGGTLVIVDEAVGVDDPTFDALESTLTGPWDRLLCLANPTANTGRFFELHKVASSASVERIHISAYDVPNVAEGREVFPGLVSRASVEDRKARWGEESAIYRSRILGEFPDGDDQALAPLSWVDAAVARWHQLQADASILWRGVGVDVEGALDVARLGRDRSVLAEARFGPLSTHLAALHRLAKSDTMTTARAASLLIDDLGLSVLRVDADGIGAGVYDRLVELNRPVVEIRGGRSAVDPVRYYNLRSEMIWGVRDQLRPGADLPLTLPPDDDLAFQITSIRHIERGDGRIAIESKDDWRKRTGKSSPDELDAVAMALARSAGGGRVFVG